MIRCVRLAAMVLLTLTAVAVPTLLSQAPAMPKRYALVVGINEYEHADLLALKVAENDAKVLAKELEGLGYTVMRLVGKEATKSAIEKGLHTICEKARKGDLVLVALSGHGVQFEQTDVACFCPVDAKPFKNRADTLVSMGKVYQELEECFATDKLLLIDACRNDPGVRGRSGIEAKSAPVPFGVAALYGCAPGQKAMEDEKLGHGLFMHSVLAGLRGAAIDPETGEVDFAGLGRYVQKQTPSRAATLPGSPRQTPTLEARYVSAPVLVPKSNGDMAKTFTNSVGMEFVLVPAGEFLMGSPEGEKHRDRDEGPQRRVKISRFYCGKHEVTRGRFAAFVRATNYRTDAEKGTEYEGGYGWDAEKKEFRADAKFDWKNPGFAQTDEHPVVLVSHNDAVAYVAWLNGKEQRKGSYGLLREAEYEYANLAGTQKIYAHGDDAEDLTKYGNVADGTAKKEFPNWPTIQAEDGHVFTAPVGRFRANGFGLHDLTGNVWEWCEDWYDGQYYGKGENLNPKGRLNGIFRVVRGGSFYDASWDCRAAKRRWGGPSGRDGNIGFRVCFRPE